MAMAAASKKKINPKALESERARPASSGSRPWRYALIGKGLTPSKLAGILSKADQGDMNELLSLAGEIERADAHVGAQIRTRRLALAALPRIVEASSNSTQDKQIATDLQRIVSGYAGSRLVFSLTDAILKPYAVCEIMWKPGDLYVPEQFLWRDQRSFAVSLEDGETLLIRTDEAPKGEPIDPYKFIIHTPRMFSGPLTTGGLVRPCAVMYSLKTLGMSSWLGYLEIFGIPWRIGKYTSGKASEDDKDTLAKAVETLGQEGGIVLPDGMEIEVENAMGSGTGTMIHQQLCDWCDRQTSKAILGQTLTADVGGGSYAQGIVHDGIRRTILMADASDLASTLQKDLIDAYCMVNYGEDVIPPTIRFDTREEDDRKTFVDFATKLADRGFRIENSVIRDRLGLPDPGAETDILQPLSAMETATKVPA